MSIIFSKGVQTLICNHFGQFINEQYELNTKYSL